MTKTTKNKMPKNAEEYYCKQCNFVCSKESNFNLHLMTTKHKIRTNTNTSVIENAEKYKCVCGKTYRHASSLWNHKQKCVSTNIVLNDSTTHELDTGIVIDKQTIMAILLQNQEMMTKIMEIMPNISNKTIYNTNNNNSHNTTNNQFNIQLFLNEHCKNAMNFTEFID